ncbi:hypothetical protein WKT22_03959 [Candidatus Lokiarchaeum ossiferum]
MIHYFFLEIHQELNFFELLTKIASPDMVEYTSRNTQKLEKKMKNHPCREKDIILRDHGRDHGRVHDHVQPLEQEFLQTLQQI